MNAFALYEGSYSVDGSKKFLPFNPETDDPKSRPGSLFIYVQPFLVKTNKHLMVLDTGLGQRAANGQLLIHENIRRAGYQPEDVNLVLMSHLHYDHSGGMTDGTQLAFPNAEYVIQRGEWENAYSKPSASYRTEIFDIVQRSGNIHFVEGSGQLTDDISYELTGGHCEFHQVFTIKNAGKTIFFGGDILPEPEQLLRRFIAKYDFDGRKAMQLREEYGHKAALEHWLCLFYHAKSTAMGYVEENEGRFKIVTV
ncbi:MBL fold metallo-hydrolase (plasmid) [Pedobacter sp. BS3]|uniref:MBL fold metallo-hydrolase n=1 Tax=Pedobacter sp. BS3 TaxID=2567937 RepID=UPI0011EBA451|nr:MBL fold metallo-hydrolase [Pedobacter sp. BS3]TZF85702.1 MBL fold metallo-hydrolase [Pedobacter sp. BS3]